MEWVKISKKISKESIKKHKIHKIIRKIYFKQ